MPFPIAKTRDGWRSVNVAWSSRDESSNGYRINYIVSERREARLDRGGFSGGLTSGQCKFANETACYWLLTRQHKLVCEHIWRKLGGILPQSKFVAFTAFYIKYACEMNIYFLLFLFLFLFKKPIVFPLRILEKYVNVKVSFH